MWHSGAFVLILMMPLVAGCLGSPESGDIAGPPRHGPMPMDVAVSRGSTEVALASTTDGTLLACSHGGFARASPLFISSTNGSSWQESPAGGRLPSGDCDVAQARDGGWLFAYQTLDGGVIVERSVDAGSSWTIVYQYPGVRRAGLVDRPWLVTADGLTGLVFTSTMRALPSIIQYVPSPDDGRSWGTPVMLPPPRTADGITRILGKPIALSSGELVVPVAVGNVYEYLAGSNVPAADQAPPRSVDLYRSKDAGRTWDSVTIVTDASIHIHFPAIAESDGGRLVAVIPFDDEGQDRDGGTTTLRSYSSQAFGSWSRGPDVAQALRFDMFALIAAQPMGDGSVGVAWQAMRTAARAWVVGLGTVDAAAQVRSTEVRIDGENSNEFISMKRSPDSVLMAAFTTREDGCAVGGVPGDEAPDCVWVAFASPAASRTETI